MKIFLDVNVIVDYVTSGDSFGMEAAEILSLAKRGDFIAVTDPNTFVIAFFRMNKIIQDPVRCKQILGEVRKLISCAVMDERILDSALLRSVPTDLEDGVQIEAAINCKADVFVTNDKKLLKIKDLKVMTTARFLKERPFESKE